MNARRPVSVGGGGNTAKPCCSSARDRCKTPSGHVLQVFVSSGGMDIWSLSNRFWSRAPSDDSNLWARSHSFTPLFCRRQSAYLSPRRGKEKVAQGKGAKRLTPWVSDASFNISPLPLT